MCCKDANILHPCRARKTEMHDSFTKGEKQNASKARRVNDCFKNSKDFLPPGMLFGEFWREGELALLFGAAGTGKSVLAMQIADSIARGRGIGAFKMEAKRQKVLYVALALSDTQIQMRYSRAARQNSNSKHHDFSRNLYRERPGPKEAICSWLRERVNEEGYKVVIIDDINELRLTYDGTRETLKLMRELKTLKDELGISILVLAGGREPGWDRAVSEADMLRSRVLCEAADSVFAIGRHARMQDSFYLTQTRSRNAPIVWNAHNAPVCSLLRAEDGGLTFEFDKRFVPKMDEKLRQLVCEVKWRMDAGATHRCIADEYGFSKSRVGQLLKKWRPDIEPPMAEPEVVEAVPSVSEHDEGIEENDAELRRYESEVGLDIDLDRETVPYDVAPDDGFTAHEAFPATHRHSCADRPALLGHLKRSLDKNDREIFVEQEDERGKPIVWYYYDTTGRLVRYNHKGFGAIGRTVDGPICLFDTS